MYCTGTKTATTHRDHILWYFDRLPYKKKKEVWVSLVECMKLSEEKHKRYMKAK